MAKGESECSMEKKTPPDEEREVISCSRNPISFFLAFRRLRILTVEPTMFFYMFGMYVFIFFHTQYIYNMFGREQFRDVLNFTGRFNFCITGHTAKEQLDPVVNGSSHYIKAQTSYLSIYVNVAGQLPGIVAALFFGTASDRIGRKPFLVAMGVCSTLAATLLLVFVHYELTPYTLIVVSSVYAIGGGMPSMITLTNAYIADVSSKRWLAVRLGIVEAMFFGGGMISVLIVGEWLRYTNCQYLQGPPILYLACNLIMVMYTLVYLPESLPREERYKRNKRRSAVKQLVRGMKIFTTFRGYSRWRLWFGLIVVGAAYFVTLGSTKINQVYLTASLGWEPDRLGQWTATIQAAHVIVLMILLPILIRLKVPSELLSTTGLLFASVTFIALGILTKTWEAFLVGILMGGRGLVGTTTRACLSRVVSPADQGSMFSVLAVVQSLGFVLGPVLFFFFYPATDHWYPGSVYFLMAALMTLPVPLMITMLIFRNGSGAIYTPHTLPLINEVVEERAEGKWAGPSPSLSVAAPILDGEKDPLLSDFGAPHMTHSWHEGNYGGVVEPSSSSQLMQTGSVRRLSTNGPI